jgi:hypothetical protein
MPYEYHGVHLAAGGIANHRAVHARIPADGAAALVCAAR